MDYWRKQMLMNWLQVAWKSSLPDAGMRIVRRVLVDAVRAGEIEQDAADASIALIMAENFDAAITVLGLDE